MPQMMPMYWLLIFIFTMLMLMTLIYMIYFFKLYSTESLKTPSPLNKQNWIWKW